LELYWYDHLLFLITAILIPLISLSSKSVSSEDSEELLLPPKKHMYYSNGLVLVIGSLLVITAWNASNRPWSMLGFQLITTNNIVLITSAILILYYLGDILSSFIKKKESEKKLQELSYILPMNFSEYKHFIFLAFAAGICEEIIFRGFLINYLNILLSTLPFTIFFAITIPALTFGLSHIYQGWKAVFKIIFISVLFGIIFVWSESLIAVIIIHILIDLISGLAGVIIVKQNK